LTIAYRFDLASKRIAVLDATATAAMPDLLTDTLYLADGVDVLPLYRGDMQDGIWRSPVFVRNDIEGFGWMMVGGDFDGAVTVRLYRDGALLHSVVAAADVMLRVPAGRGREWEVELEGDIRAATLTLAGSAEELKLAGAARAA